MKLNSYVWFVSYVYSYYLSYLLFVIVIFNMLLLWFCRTVFFCNFEYLLFLKYVDVILVIFDLLYIYVWGIIALCTFHLAMRGVNLVYWIVNEFCFERGVILYFLSVRVCHRNASLYIRCYFCSSKSHYVWFSS